MLFMCYLSSYASSVPAIVPWYLLCFLGTCHASMVLAPSAVNKRTIHDCSTSAVAYDEDNLLAYLDVLEQMHVLVRALSKGEPVLGICSEAREPYQTMDPGPIYDWPVFRQCLDRAGTYLRALGCQCDFFTKSRVNRASLLLSLSLTRPLSYALSLSPYLFLLPSQIIIRGRARVKADAYNGHTSDFIDTRVPNLLQPTL
jgi:hypothetical protein